MFASEHRGPGVFACGDTEQVLADSATLRHLLRSTMSRYAQALHEIGVADPVVVETLCPLIKAFYDASARLHRALAPHGGTTHAVLSRCSSPSHDPDAMEVQWMSVFDKMGLFDVTDTFTAGMTDALFRYIWRHREVSGYIAHLASQRPQTQSRGAADDIGGTANNSPVKLAFPSQTSWIYGSQPAVVIPSSGALSVVRTLIKSLDKLSNPAVVARDTASCALLALHKHVISTVYKSGGTGDAHDVEDDPGPAAAGMASGRASSTDTGEDHSMDVDGQVGPVVPRTEASLRNFARGSRANDGAGALEREAGLSSDRSTAARTAAQLFCAAQTPTGSTPSANPAAAAEAASGSGQGDTPGAIDAASMAAAAVSTQRLESPVSPSSVAGATPSTDAASNAAAGAPLENGMGAALGAAPDASGVAVFDAARHASLQNGPGDAANLAAMATSPSGSAVSAALPVGSTLSAAQEASRREAGTETAKMGTLMSHFKCTWWPSFKSPGAAKAVAPAGTGKNPKGSVSVMTWTTVWGHQVDLSPIKTDLAAVGLSQSAVYTAGSSGDIVQIIDITNMRKKSLFSVLGLLLLVCSKEPSFSGTLADILSSPVFGAVPPGRSALVGTIVQVGRRERAESATGDAPDSTLPTQEQPTRRGTTRATDPLSDARSAPGRAASAAGSKSTRRPSPAPPSSLPASGGAFVPPVRPPWEGSSPAGIGASGSGDANVTRDEGGSSGGGGSEGRNDSGRRAPATDGAGARDGTSTAPWGLDGGSGAGPSDLRETEPADGGSVTRAPRQDPAAIAAGNRNASVRRRVGGSDVRSSRTPASVAAYYIKNLPTPYLRRQYRLEQRRKARKHVPERAAPAAPDTTASSSLV